MPLITVLIVFVTESGLPSRYQPFWGPKLFFKTAVVKKREFFSPGLLEILGQPLAIGAPPLDLQITLKPRGNLQQPMRLEVVTAVQIVFAHPSQSAQLQAPCLSTYFLNCYKYQECSRCISWCRRLRTVNPTMRQFSTCHVFVLAGQCLIYGLVLRKFLYTQSPKPESIDAVWKTQNRS